jgi:hypothetical protein
MKKLVLIHTVHSVIETFDRQLHEQIPELTLYHLLDEFLSIDPNQRHGFTSVHEKRLDSLLQLALDAEPDLIACTCSTLSEHLRRRKETTVVPLITIDEEMIRFAAASDLPILILATAPSSVPPLVKGLSDEMQKNGRAREIESKVFPKAFEALQQQGRAAHDAILLELAKGIIHDGMILLSQASMAHMQEAIQALLHCPTYSAPGLCIQQIKKQLEGRA